MAEGGPLSDLQHARADLIRAQLAYVTGRGSDAPPLLLKAAQRLEPIDAALSRATYLDALTAALFAGRLARAAGFSEVARAAQPSPRPATPRLCRPSSRWLRDILHRRICGGPADSATAPSTLPARDGRPTTSCAGCAWPASPHARLGRRRAGTCSRRVTLTLARAAGALTELPLALSSRAGSAFRRRTEPPRKPCFTRPQTVTEATGDSFAPYGALILAAFRGDQARLSEFIEATTTDAMSSAGRHRLTVAELARCDAEQRHRRTTAGADPRAARRRTGRDIGVSAWGAVELIEAAVRAAT